MEEEETVADDIEWDNLENEDALIGIGSSLQASGPFPFHGGEGTSRDTRTDCSHWRPDASVRLDVRALALPFF